MASEPETTVQYLFQDQILDTDRRELRRGAERIALGPQVFDLLVYLLRNREHVVSKDDLLRYYRGETELAIEHLRRAMRLSPLDPTLYQMQVGTGFAHLLAGRFNEASSWAEKAFREEPNYLVAAAVTAASHALAGRLEQATQAMARVRLIDPSLRLSNLKDWFPIRRPEHFSLWADGLRKAGLPEQ
jgi:tetratricopeptide (TPR) repeat protein